ncbi:cAMP-independent regulatory protein pac2 [Akanthomyces lecanii RCEF 1005]|uniref:cAMP-independent regulatory protein pac2 n=1 Tax=Akanthomyces lecanii RCEF 1005 TaxID=1081108 RepID=A0A168CXB2_CORDF|nr:cAMP-independent regulatory protein pac2 [Akanthomyces lecanii RCEF 1005]
MENQSAPLVPTFEGHISTTLDGLILFEACLTGVLNHVPRRPHDRERQELIKSGNIFIYEEHSSGIKRWTDGVSWSPSRILGNFLIYRELDKPFPPGEKKRALKKSKKSPQGIVKSEPLATLNMPYVGAAGLDQSGNSKDQERSLIGSLVDSYSFKDNGLVKKTISVSFNGVTHHMVSYYNVDDVTSGKLETPSSSVHLRGITPRPALLLSQNFRTPVHEVEYALATDNTGAMTTQYGPDHGSINGSTGVLHRAMMQGNLQSAMNLNSIHQSGSSPSYMFPQHATTTPNGYPASHSTATPNGYPVSHSTSTQNGYPSTHPTSAHDGYSASHSTGAQNGYAGHVANSSFQAAIPQQMSYGGNPAGNYSLYHHMEGAPGEVWNFPGLEGDSDQQYYAQGHVQWPNGPNSLHRT